MTKVKKDLAQTAIRIERELLNDLRARALFLNISLQKWFHQAIAEKILRENKTK